MVWKPRQRNQGFQHHLKSEIKKVAWLRLLPSPGPPPRVKLNCLIMSGFFEGGFCGRSLTLFLRVRYFKDVTRYLPWLKRPPFGSLLPLGHQEGRQAATTSLSGGPFEFLQWWRCTFWHVGWCFLVAMWVFPKIEVPQNGWFIMENPIKMGCIWGTTIFGNTHVYTLVN